MGIDLNNFGKGAVRTPKEIRDKQYRLAATPPLSVTDWSISYKVNANIPVLNQDGSSSCTAHATSNYCMFLESVEGHPFTEFSRRYIYSQSNLGANQGAYIWKAMSVPLTGLADEVSVPDGQSDEITELDSSLNASAHIVARADKYAVIPKSNIDQMAQIVKDYHGFITGFNGHNGMFSSDGTVIDWSTSDWGHAIYVYGYEIRDGIKCLRFRNSWSDAWGSGGDGFFPEGFVNSGMMFDCYTYADVTDLDPNSMNILSDGQLEQLWQAIFHRSIDQAALTFYHGSTLDRVLSDIMGSKELAEYGKIFQAAKSMENDIRSGAF